MAESLPGARGAPARTTELRSRTDGYKPRPAVVGKSHMGLVESFVAYADDFERTFVDDDWSRLERYFADDAVYSTPTNGLRVEGREAVLAALRAAVSGFDRRCDTRELASTVGPAERGDEVWREWEARFTLAGAPDLMIGGS